jgi:hypothetical protein
MSNPQIPQIHTDSDLVGADFNYHQQKMLAPFIGELKFGGYNSVFRLVATRAQLRQVLHGFEHGNVKLEKIVEYQRWNRISDLLRKAIDGPAIKRRAA